MTEAIWEIYLVGVVAVAILGNNDKIELPLSLLLAFFWPISVIASLFIE